MKVEDIFETEEFRTAIRHASKAREVFDEELFGIVSSLMDDLYVDDDSGDLAFEVLDELKDNI